MNSKIKIILISVWLFLFNFFSITPVHALSIAARVPEKYTNVQAGERFYFEIEIKYPENIKRKDLRLGYEIEKEGKVIAQAKVLKAIETQASFMDYIVIPENIKSGMCNINIVISDYEELREEVSASFYVSGGNDKLMIYFLILLGAIFAVGGLVVWNIKRFSEYKEKHK